MKLPLPLQPTPALLVALLALFVALAETARPHGGNASKIHACVLTAITSSRAANVRIIEPSGGCASGSPVDWVIDADPSPNTIRTEHIVDQNVRANDLAPGSIGPAQLADRAVTTAAILSGAVNSGHVRDESLTAADLASGSVAQQELAAGSVTGSKLAPFAVTEGKLAPHAVTTDSVKNDSIKGGDINNGSITGDDIANSSLTGLDVHDGTILSADIGKSMVRGEHVLDGTITGDDIAKNSINWNDFAFTISVRTDKGPRVYNRARKIRTALCLPNYRVIAGGALIRGSPEPHIISSYPDTLSSWTVEADGGALSASWSLVAYAICVKT